jgi:hypothetical protein
MTTFFTRVSQDAEGPVGSSSRLEKGKWDIHGFVRIEVAHEADPFDPLTP